MKRSLGLSLALVSALAIAGIGTASHGDHGHGKGKAKGHDSGSDEGNDSHDRNRPPALIAFGSMYGVDGPFVGDTNPLDDIPGDELPWEIESARGRLDVDGNLVLAVRGLVFANEPDLVPPNLIGTNDEDQFRATVSCLTEQGNAVVRQNVTTEGFPADHEGNSFIHAHLTLPNPCVAPAVFVLAGSEDKWFAVTGFESEEN